MGPGDAAGRSTVRQGPDGRFGPSRGARGRARMRARGNGGQAGPDRAGSRSSLADPLLGSVVVVLGSDVTDGRQYDARCDSPRSHDRVGPPRRLRVPRDLRPPRPSRSGLAVGRAPGHAHAAPLRSRARRVLGVDRRPRTSGRDHVCDVDAAPSRLLVGPHPHRRPAGRHERVPDVRWTPRGGVGRWRHDLRVHLARPRSCVAADTPRAGTSGRSTWARSSGA